MKIFFKKLVKLSVIVAVARLTYPVLLVWLALSLGALVMQTILNKKIASGTIGEKASKLVTICIKSKMFKYTEDNALLFKLSILPVAKFVWMWFLSDYFLTGKGLRTFEDMKAEANRYMTSTTATASTEEKED